MSNDKYLSQVKQVENVLLGKVKLRCFGEAVVRTML